MFAFNYRTISYCFSITDTAVVMQDCEEKNSETEKSNEKNEKKEVREYLFLNKVYELNLSDQRSFKQQSKLLFASSDYSMAVYSPPEKAVI